MYGFCELQRYLRLLAKRKGLDEHVAEELVQETLFKLWRRKSLPVNRFGWAGRVFTNLANNHYRRVDCERRAMSELRDEYKDRTDYKPRAKYSLALLGLVEGDVTRILEMFLARRHFAEQTCVLLAEAVRSLSNADRQFLHLFLEHGCEARSVAGHLGRGVRTVQNRRKRILEQLQIFISLN